MKGNNMDYKNLALQFKADDTGLEGYAATFGNVDSVGDIIVKGAFAGSILKRKPKFMYQHSTDELIGVVNEAYEDEQGLFIQASFAKTQAAQDARELVKMGAIGEMSIGYSTKQADYRSDGVRLLKEIDLYEVSLVTFPANEMAKITKVKSAHADEREFERFLRDAGYSRTDAKTITSHGFKALNQRDADVKRDEELAQLMAQFKQLFTKGN